MFGASSANVVTIRCGIFGSALTVTKSNKIMDAMALMGCVLMKVIMACN